MENEKVFVDALGQQVPVKYVKAYDRLRDKIARSIARDWKAEQVRLEALKNSTIDRIEQLRKASAKEAGVKELGGREGYIQFRSFDGSITVRLDNAKRTEFDERLELAQRLIMEAVRELSQDSQNADLVEIATRAFQPRKGGNLDMQRIRELRSYKVSHPKWKQAVQIISDCERVIGHRRYVRVDVREDAGKEPASICLDISRL